MGNNLVGTAGWIDTSLIGANRAREDIWISRVDARAEQSGT